MRQSETIITLLEAEFLKAVTFNELGTMLLVRELPVSLNSVEDL